MSKARDLAGIFNLNPLSGTTAQRPATAEVGEIYYNGTTGKTQIYTPTGWQDMASGIPYGNTAGRPAAVTGQPYFNGEIARLEMYTTASGWQNIVQEVPGVASITGNYSEATNSGTIVIQGTNFVSGAIASAIGTNGVEVLASSTTYNSLVQITAAFTGLSNAYEPYDIKVTNPSNLFGLIPDALYVNASPVWQTASGSLGTFTEEVSISVSATATDSDSTISYALASGSTLPSGVSLNSSTGAIAGTLPNISTDTTYSFIINATDGVNTIPRTFSISSTATATAEILLVAGGGAGGGFAYGGGGGAGGLVYYSASSLIKGSTYALSVGSGGPQNSSRAAQTSTNGGNTSFSGLTTAIGGGTGGGDDYDGITGGSSGGNSDGGSNGTGGLTIAPTSGQGFSGGRATDGTGAAGGGGAGGAGSNSPSLGGNRNGGPGLQYSITGTALYYAGGGGGSTRSGGSNGSGGSGVGGSGVEGGTGTAGTAGTGSGGGGGTTGGAGGSGVIVIAYPDTFSAISNIPGTLTYDQPTRSGYRVYRFTAGSGTVTF